MLLGARREGEIGYRGSMDVGDFGTEQGRQGDGGCMTSICK